MTALADLVGTDRGSATAPPAETGPAVQRSAPRVNLLPPEVVTRRQVRLAQRTGLGAVAAVVVLVAASWGVGAVRTGSAQDDLDAANSRVSALQAQQAEYAAAPQTIARLEAAQSARSTAMAQDVSWAAYVDSLARALPAGAWLVSVQSGLTSGPTSSAATSSGTAPGAATGSLGPVTISASATSYEDVAAYLDALASVPGVSDPYLTGSAQDSTSGTPLVTFTVTAQMTEDALTHRFDTTTEQKAG